MIPYSKIKFTANEIKSVVQTLKRGWISEGKKTNEFEKLFASKLGVNKKNTIAVSSCTAGLELVLRTLKLKKKDEVLIPSLTFVADANSVINSGGKPVLVDIKSKYNLNIDIDDLEKKINKNTKAVIIVHYAGFPCNMKRILDLKKKYNFFLIEDSCHALFSTYKKKILGSFGDASVFSFYSNKNMTTAEGGMIYLRDKKKIMIVKKLKNHGITKSLLKRHNNLPGYDVVLPGTNFRFDDIKATLGISQLIKLDKMNKIRQKIANRYVSLLEKYKVNVIIPFKDHFNEKMSFHLFVVIINSKINRKKILNFLKKKQIFLSFHYTPIHNLSFYKKKINLKNIDLIKNKILSLPIHPYLKRQEQKKIVLCLKQSLNI